MLSSDARATYTSRFSRRHKLFGHLFGGKYKSLILDGSGNGYLRTVCDYEHLNSAPAKLLAADQPLSDYPWSSHGEYLKPPGRRMPCRRVDRLLGLILNLERAVANERRRRLLSFYE
jgi:hypothetical protein